MHKLNVLHWIIYMRRNDIFNFLFQRFFQPKDLPENGCSSDEEDHSCQTSLQNLQDCVRGQNASFYDIDYFKAHKIKKDIAALTIQIITLPKSAYSKNIREQITNKQQVQIHNLGLVVIIQSKNLNALQMLI